MALITPTPGILESADAQSLFKLLQAGEHVWVVNTLDKDIVCGLHDKGTTGLYFPEGPDPLCLTEAVTPEDLKNCRDLRITVIKGALKVISEADARTYYQDNSGREQVVAEKIKRLRDKAALDPIPQATEAPEIAARIMGMIQEFNGNTLPEVRAMEELEQRKATWTRADLSHLRANIKSRAIQLWAEEFMDEKFGGAVNVPAPSTHGGPTQPLTQTQQQDIEPGTEEFHAYMDKPEGATRPGS